MQGVGLSRNATLDKFYTKKEVAFTCIDAVHNLHDLTSFDIVLEPAAGNGAFSLPLKAMLGERLIAFDIAPEHESIVQQDFFTMPLESLEKWGSQRTLVISNVPFGRQGALARRFVKHSCSFASVIAFILPRSFKKQSLQKALPLKWHLVHETDLPEDAFEVNGGKHSVPCVFQIWEKRDMFREQHVKVEPEGYTFVKKDMPLDIIIRRVGVYAGKACVAATEKDGKNAATHYFIKLDDGIAARKEEIGVKINSHLWEFNNTVGPRSLSKYEMIPIINKIVLELP
jgi:predicted RNA methylase